MPSLLRAALLGLATGGRSHRRPDRSVPDRSAVDRRLGNRWTRRLAGTAAAGEWLGDKLPQTPEPVAAGGAAAPAGLRRGGRGDPHLPRRAAAAAGRRWPPRLGLLGAVAGSRLGAAWRQQAARRFGADLPGALIEDAWVLGAARYASRPR